MKETIRICDAHEHNLRNISVEIPKNKLVVFTGVSGSGKSSLVFSTIYAEAQRQLLETFSAYTRSRMAKIARPKVESIENLPVAIVIDQKRLGGNSSSTVGTVTEIYNHLRLLYSRCGTPPIGDSVNFSFNRPEGMCPECRGLGSIIALNESRLYNAQLSLNEGSLLHPRFKKDSWYFKRIIASGFFDASKPLKEFSRKELDTLLYSGKRYIVNKTEDRPWNLSYEGIVPTIKRHLSNNDDGEIEDPDYDAYFNMQQCPVCHGARLKAEALAVKLNGKAIHELCAMELTDLAAFLTKVPDSMDSTGRGIAEPIIGNITKRLSHMIKIGVGYLSLDRPTGTLSGGESQRVKMSRQLGCDLTGLLYILDEPSIGLHPRDIDNLIEIMRDLRDKGNTVLVIEHDPEIITCADHVIDVGPAGGSQGGNIVFEGSVGELVRSGTVTGEHLCRKGTLGSQCRKPSGAFEIRNANQNNLRNVSVSIPAGVLCCVTGVAGSGKSTLINNCFRKAHPQAVVIDQSAITRSRRSTPASYTKVLDLIRKEFAKATGADAGLFSFNSSGACPACQGLGEIEVEMHFLESVTIPCEACKGRRFRSEVLALTMNGRSIADVLEGTIDDAIAFFHNKEIRRRLKILSDIGLGYLGLGQTLASLSGGEAQRVKLGSELRKSGNIYVMDEPTTGLHMSDIARLSKLMQRLVDAGNSLIVIEHNLEIIAQADWIIDMGPQGGKRGGTVVARGRIEDICGNPHSVTGTYLREFLDSSRQRSAG